jgi:hypothetical protein
MKNLTLLLILLTAFQGVLFSQSCLPEGITFETQSQIDSFQVNYPVCERIEGDVNIIGMEIANLSGLIAVNSINGALLIKWTDLINLSGLDSLTYIGGGLTLLGNSYLLNFTGLENVTCIRGDLDIRSNSLIDISGLSNLTADSIINIFINHNYSLTNCQIQGLCDYLSNPAGIVEIYNNAPGCDYPGDISSKCGIDLPCLPYGNYYFMTQEAIDSFQFNYPGCSELNGYVLIQGYEITNLEGLMNVTSISGDLDIIDNIDLTSLNGLNNLSTIRGSFNLSDNIYLQGLGGLENLSSIEGNFWIIRCHSLHNLYGLEELNSIGGDLEIRYNVALSSLEGLDDLNAGTIDNLTICGNDSLSNCDVQCICNYLSSPAGIVDIYDNGPGCNNPPEIASSCGTSLPCLPHGNYYFISQNEIDSFQSYYPDCPDLKGNILIEGEDIFDLIGLSSINSIEGDLVIGEGRYPWSNPNLQNLTGLEGLTAVGGKLQILDNHLLNSLTGLNHIDTIKGDMHIGRNYNLTSLEPLEELKYIGGWLDIFGDGLLENLHGLENIDSIGGVLYIMANDNLSSISELAGLTKIGGELHIESNHVLTSLKGLDNISASSIEGLYLFSNPSLSSCEVQSICDYLASPSAYVDIHDNNPGCDSREEVELACATISVDDLDDLNTYSIYPNPSSTQITIETPKTTSKLLISIFTLSGQEVIRQQITESRTVIDIRRLPQGLYFLKLTDDDSVNVLKVVKK